MYLIQWKKFFFIFNIVNSQSNSPVKIDFEWNPHKDQEGTIASVDKPGINYTGDSCIQGKFYI